MSTTYGTQDAINFLLGKGCDGRGRHIEDYFKFSSERWEECHDHIQWAFPSDIPSQFNLNAPVINKDELFDFGADCGIEVKIAIFDNMNRLLEDYLLSIGFDHKMYRPIESTYIFTPDNHNFRRLTRAIRSFHLFHACTNLRDFGLVAGKLKRYLLSHGLQYAIANGCSGAVNSETVWHWYNAGTPSYTRSFNVQPQAQSQGNL